MAKMRSNSKNINALQNMNAMFEFKKTKASDTATKTSEMSKVEFWNYSRTSFAIGEEKTANMQSVGQAENENYTLFCLSGHNFDNQVKIYSAWLSKAGYKFGIYTGTTKPEYTGLTKYRDADGKVHVIISESTQKFIAEKIRTSRFTCMASFEKLAFDLNCLYRANVEGIIDSAKTFVEIKNSFSVSSIRAYDLLEANNNFYNFKNAGDIISKKFQNEFFKQLMDEDGGTKLVKAPYYVTENKKVYVNSEVSEIQFLGIEKLNEKYREIRKKYEIKALPLPTTAEELSCLRDVSTLIANEYGNSIMLTQKLEKALQIDRNNDLITADEYLEEKQYINEIKEDSSKFIEGNAFYLMDKYPLEMIGDSIILSQYYKLNKGEFVNRTKFSYNGEAGYYTSIASKVLVELLKLKLTKNSRVEYTLIPGGDSEVINGESYNFTNGISVVGILKGSKFNGSLTAEVNKNSIVMIEDPKRIIIDQLNKKIEKYDGSVRLSLYLNKRSDIEISNEVLEQIKDVRIKERKVLAIINGKEAVIGTIGTELFDNKIANSSIVSIMFSNELFATIELSNFIDFDAALEKAYQRDENFKIEAFVSKTEDYEEENQVKDPLADLLKHMENAGEDFFS